MSFYSFNQGENASKNPNIGLKPTINGNGINNSTKLNNNSSNGSLNDSNGKCLNIDEVRVFAYLFLCIFDLSNVLEQSKP